MLPKVLLHFVALWMALSPAIHDPDEREAPLHLGVLLFRHPLRHERLGGRVIGLRFNRGAPTSLPPPRGGSGTRARGGAGTRPRAGHRARPGWRWFAASWP